MSNFDINWSLMSKVMIFSNISIFLTLNIHNFRKVSESISKILTVLES